MLKRRRKSKFTWMPILGGLFQSSPGPAYFGGRLPVLGSTGKLADGPYVTPIVPDETPQPTDASATLRDFTEGQDWFLRRIVGKLTFAWDFVPGGEGGTFPVNTIIGAGFFVARAREDNPNLPDLDIDEYDVLANGNIRSPWLWRRTWILGSHVSGGAAGWETFYQFPSNNWQTGSALDGPHVDAKTLRRIRREERLWFTWSGNNFDLFPGSWHATQLDAQVTFGLDYRVLGQMRRSNNRSTF